MIVKIDHVGIAVSSLDDVIGLYATVFGLKKADIEIETLEAEKIKAAMIPAGDNRIELMESTDPEGVIAKYIGRKGEGVHHLAIEVTNIQNILDTLKAEGVPLVDTKPRIGVGGSKAAFIHPKGTKALIELVEH